MITDPKRRAAMLQAAYGLAALAIDSALYAVDLEDRIEGEWSALERDVIAGLTRKLVTAASTEITKRAARAVVAERKRSEQRWPAPRAGRRR